MEPGLSIPPSPEADVAMALPENRKRLVLPVRKAAVVSQPHTYLNILQGVNYIAKAVKPTLGPMPRLVALEGLKRTDAVEFLDDGAIIARRIRRIIPRGHDVGAMMLRHAMWKIHEDVGDGATTMAVLYQAVLSEGIRYVTEFSANAMLLRKGLETGLKAIVEEIRKQAIPLKERKFITNLALGICQGDEELAGILGEIFDIVGADGLIEVEGWNQRHLDREFVEGTYWKLCGYYSREFLTNPVDFKEIYEDAALLITDMDFKDPNQLVPVLEKCVKSGVKKLVIIAGGCSDQVTGLLVSNTKAKTIQAMAVRTPRIEEMDRFEAIQDIAILTGGKYFNKAAGDILEAFQVEDLGHARRAWAAESMFGIYGGKGNPRLIRQRIAELQGKLMRTDRANEFLSREMQSRLSRLVGGTAILHIGGIYENEITARKEVASRAVNSLRHAIRGGVVPGGGIALLNARAILKSLPAENEDMAYAFRILNRALEEPLRVIADNAGYFPEVILERISLAPAGYGFDATTGKIVDMQENRILDPLIVLEKAVQTAVTGASMALTTDVIIHHKRPNENPANP
jgi:chaperonin GroEL